MKSEFESQNKTKLLSPKLDVVFQALFGEVGNENITKRFLEAILNRKIESIDLSQNPILRREHITDKLGILDVIAKINNTEICNIEIQLASQDEIIERLLYYWGRTYSRQIKSGNDYDKLQKTISILIANFNINGLEKLNYCTSWKIIEEKHRKTILTDKLEIYIIELSKIANLQNDNNELLDWLFFLEDPKSERVIKKMENNKELKQANEKLEKISHDIHMQRIADWREKAILDENSALSSRYRKGLEQGKADGLKEGIKRNIEYKNLLVKMMLSNNEPIEKIQLYSGYSIEQIEKIQNKLRATGQ